PVADKLEYPVGMGRQDYWLGKPIAPAELAALPYKARTERVMDAINALGPREEAPFAADPALDARVRTWMTTTGSEIGPATVLAVLGDAEEPSDAAKRLVEGARRGLLEVGTDPHERWLGELARRLYGPRGPVVR